MFPLFNKILLCLWLSAIIASSLVDYSAFSSIKVSTEGGAGLIYHFMMYLIAAALSWMAFRNHHTRVIFIIGVLLFIFGTGFETLQIYLPYRTFNPKDIAANIIGLALGYGLIFIWQVIRKTNSNRYSPQAKNT